MSNRIKDCFANLEKNGKKALMPYITAGDSNKSITVPLMHRMVESGADIIELGIPFSDPMADGPTVQLACERALVHNTSITDVIEMVKEFREHDAITPIILMGYLNPVENLGYEAFAKAANEAGVDGLLTVDLPPEESIQLTKVLSDYDIDPIFLLSPTTTTERIKTIVNAASGFLYYVSLKGVTGSSILNVQEVSEKVSAIKEHTNLPIGVGFGIKDDESAAKISAVSDGAIVGSAIVKIIEENIDDTDTILDSIGELLKSMRVSMDA